MKNNRGYDMSWLKWALVAVVVWFAMSMVYEAADPCHKSENPACANVQN